ncbi:MAG: hypothetical protein U5M50_09970 [Sphingobium sp.]|nr:hypothetical protein [Sphingobium sp.]
MKALFLKAASLAVLAVTVAQPAFARPAPADLSLADSFRIGDAGVLCTAQSRLVDPALSSMFDRAHAIFCRDAAATMGKLLCICVAPPGRGLAKPASPPRALRSICSCGGSRPFAYRRCPASMVRRVPTERDGPCAMSVLFAWNSGSTPLYVAEGLAGYLWLRVAPWAGSRIVAEAPVGVRRSVEIRRDSGAG